MSDEAELVVLRGGDRHDVEVHCNPTFNEVIVHSTHEKAANGQPIVVPHARYVRTEDKDEIGRTVFVAALLPTP